VHGSITLERLAEDLAEMLDHFGLERPVLVGHSMGALMLMQYLHSYGTQRVAAVGLVDQSPRIVTDDSWRLGLFGGCSASMLSGLIAGARRDLAETLLNEVGALGGAWLRRQLGAEASLGRMLRRRLGRFDVRPLLDLAALPDATLEQAARWIAGRVDVFEEGRQLASPRISGARVSLPSDTSFDSYEHGVAHVSGPPLGADVQLATSQALIDVMLDYVSAHPESRIRPPRARNGSSGAFAGRPRRAGSTKR
jgi:pimeloyl-ACP methyl ester carboxylesterase